MARRSRGSGSIEQLEAGRWRVRWYTRDGRHPSRTFTLKADAEKFLRRVLVDSERDAVDLAPRSLTVDALCDHWWATITGSVKPRTAERYEDHLEVIRDRLGDVPIGELGYERVQLFVAQLQEQYASKTVRGTYGVLALVLKHAQRLGHMPRAIPKPVLPRVAKPKLRIPTLLEVDQLANASDARLWAPVILAGYCGLREGELLALHWRDVHLDRRSVFVHHARNKTSGALETTKTEGVRNVALPAIVGSALEQHRAEFEDGVLVVPVSASVLQKSWERARKACGLEEIRFHDLRHSAASFMIAAGLSVLQVSKQLGHANATQTLDTYGHLWPDSADDAIRKMDAYLDHD